jgi:hypothetical protein
MAAMGGETNGSPTAAIRSMRTFLILVIAASLGGLFYWQKHNAEAPPPADTHVTAQTSPQPPREIYKHDWAKHSIDRARDVGSAAAAQTKQSQDP